MIYYFTVVNIINFVLYFIDKKCAIKKKERISEFALLLFSLFGGFIGGLCGMVIFHHKTKKKKFWIINILSMLIWIYLKIIEKV